MLKLFNINNSSLNIGNHEFDWDIDNTFFEALTEPIINKGQLKVVAKVQKSEHMVLVDLIISGNVTLECDRSLEEFLFPLETETRHFFKFASEFEELSEDVTNIPFNTEKINIAQLIYETIGIAVPMKKLHPKFQDDETDEEIELVYSNEVEETEAEDQVDPRWEALKKLKETK